MVFVTVYRASTIKGMEVRDSTGKDLGSPSELIIDLKEGKAKYGILSSGSVAGFGGKLYAIPFTVCKLQHTADDKHFALSMSHEKFRSAPSFESNRWPSFSDANWTNEIDRFCGEVRTAERPENRKD